MPDNDEIGLAEAAKIMGVSWGQAWNAMLKGEISGRKVGGRWYVMRSSIYARDAERESQ